MLKLSKLYSIHLFSPPKKIFALVFNFNNFFTLALYITEVLFTARHVYESHSICFMISLPRLNWKILNLMYLYSFKVS